MTIARLAAAGLAGVLLAFAAVSSAQYPARTVWIVVTIPPGDTPEAVLGRLREEIAKTLASPDVKEKLARAGGLQPFVTSPAEFSALIRRDYDKYGKLVREIGVRAD